ARYGDLLAPAGVRDRVAVELAFRRMDERMRCEDGLEVRKRAARSCEDPATCQLVVVSGRGPCECLDRRACVVLRGLRAACDEALRRRKVHRLGVMEGLLRTLHRGIAERDATAVEDLRRSNRTNQEDCRRPAGMGAHAKCCVPWFRDLRSRGHAASLA